MTCQFPGFVALSAGAAGPRGVGADGTKWTPSCMARVRHTGMMLAHFGGIDEIGILVVPVVLAIVAFNLG